VRIRNFRNFGDVAIDPFPTPAVTEALPTDRPATLVLEVPEEGDEQDLAAATTIRVSWLHRLGAPAGDSSALAAEAAEIELPPGCGHAYLFGEATGARAGRTHPTGGRTRGTAAARSVSTRARADRRPVRLPPGPCRC